MNKEMFVWSEKYRPKDLSEMVLNEEHRHHFEKYIEEQAFPHLLLFGRHGTGKTTLAKILVNKLNLETLKLNASDERGIGTVRDKIKEFVSIMAFGNKFRVVFLDEADALTPDAQFSLRSVIEENTMNARFILTANYIQKIIPAIQSRLQLFEFSQLPKAVCLSQIEKILTGENIKFNVENVEKIYNMANGDVRKMINLAQMNCDEGKLIIRTGFDWETDFVKAFKSEKLDEMRQFLANYTVDYNDLYKYLYDKTKTPSFLLLIAEYSYRNAFVVDPEINFIGFLCKVWDAK